MPFWITWFLIGAFVTTTAAYTSQNASNVAAYNPPTTQIEQGGKEGN